MRCPSCSPRPRLRLSLLTGLILLAPLPTRADDPFVDSRLTVTLGDDDLLRDSGESVPNTPRVGFGDRPGYELFYDNLNTRFSGRESLTHLVFHRTMPSFFEDLTTEAAVVLRALLFNQGQDPVALEDTGSYVRLTYHPFDDPDDGLALTAFPFNADRVRLGYLYDLSVGGDGFFPRSHWFHAPGLRLRLDRGPLYVWAAFKAVLGPTELSEFTNEQDVTLQVAHNRTLYSGLGGLGLHLFERHLLLEAQGGFFERAESPIKDVAGEKVWAAGGAARLVLHHDLPVERSIDYALYRNDPNRPFLAFTPVRYAPDRTGWLVSAETVALAQRLSDPELYGKTTLEPAVAAALRAQLQRGYLRLELTAVQRDLAFLLLDNPGFMPFTALSDDTAPERFLALAGDYHLPGLHLTLGLSAGLLWPAHLTTELYATASGSNAPPTLIGTHTLLVYASGQRIILPEGEQVRPRMQARASARLDLSEMLYTRLWLQYGYDPNNTFIEVNADLSKDRISPDRHALGLGVSAALRL